MKKIYLLSIAFLSLLPRSFSQNISGVSEHLSWLFYEDGSVNYEMLMLNYLIVFLVFSIIYYVVARFETSNHLIDRFPHEGQKFLYAALLVSIALHIGLTRMGLWIVFVRIIIASYISSDAKNLGRSKILWWILIFIEPNVALLILARVPKLIRGKREDKIAIESIFVEYDGKLDNLGSLRLSGVLEGLEYRNKKKILDNLYMSKRDEILKEKYQKENSSIVDTSTILGQLEKAYEDGILTIEEYEVKRQNLSK